MSNSDDRDRDRRSWREIDRKKDKSSHIDRSDPYKKSKRGARTDGRSKSYKAALDSFFDGGALPERYQKLSKTRDAIAGGPGSERQAALKNLRDAVGQSEIIKAFKVWMEVDGEMPRDVEALLSILQHPDEVSLRDAIATLKELAAERPLKRAELLRQRLKKIETLADEKETQKAAAELRRLIV
jgi:hypothetical protein